MVSLGFNELIGTIENMFMAILFGPQNVNSMRSSDAYMSE